MNYQPTIDRLNVEIQKLEKLIIARDALMEFAGKKSNRSEAQRARWAEQKRKQRKRKTKGA